MPSPSKADRLRTSLSLPSSAIVRYGSSEEPSQWKIQSFGGSPRYLSPAEADAILYAAKNGGSVNLIDGSRLTPAPMGRTGSAHGRASACWAGEQCQGDQSLCQPWGHFLRWHQHEPVCGQCAPAGECRPFTCSRIFADYGLTVV